MWETYYQQYIDGKAPLEESPKAQHSEVIVQCERFKHGGDIHTKMGVVVQAGSK